MSTFHFQGGSATTPPIEVRGPGDVEVELAVFPPFSGTELIEVQESADTVNWVSHRFLPSMGQEEVVHLPEDGTRGFVRLRLDSGESDGPPRRIRFRVRRRSFKPEDDLKNGAP